jgi:glycosyltransferase involved in cell wall biosynthesis
MINMKVLQVVPELNSGGVEEVTISFANFLAKEGHESLVLSNGGNLVAELDASGSRHLQLPVHKKSLFSLAHVPALVRLLKEERPDILHLRSRAPAWLCYLAWRKLPQPIRPTLVTTVHGFYSVNSYSAIMTRGQKVLCVSHAIRDYVLANYRKVPPSRLQVVHEGICATDFPYNHHPSPSWMERWQEEFPETKGQRLLVLPGRLTRLKGHETFLHLLARLTEDSDDLHGVIVGGAHPKKKEYAIEMESLADDLGLAKKVTFTGQREDLRDILAISEIAFSLSQQPESFGLTVLEALSLGTPVIGYHDGGVAEILNEIFPTGAVPRDDFEALVQRTSSLLANPQTVPRNETFLSEKSHHETLECYQDLLSASLK